MQKVSEEAKLDYHLEDNGEVTFALTNANVLNSASVKSAILELTDWSGEVQSVNMEIIQSEEDPNVYWCLGKTKLKESEIRGLKADVYFNIKGFDHYLIATLYP